MCTISMTWKVRIRFNADKGEGCRWEAQLCVCVCDRIRQIYLFADIWDWYWSCPKELLKTNLISLVLRVVIFLWDFNLDKSYITRPSETVTSYFIALFFSMCFILTDWIKRENSRGTSKGEKNIGPSVEQQENQRETI